MIQSARSGRVHEAQPHLRQRLAALYVVAMPLLAFVAAASLLYRYAFEADPGTVAALDRVDVGVVVAFCLKQAIDLLAAPSLRVHLGQRRPQIALVMALLLGLLLVPWLAGRAVAFAHAARDVAIFLLQGFLIATEGYRLVTAAAQRLALTPPILVALSFALLIAIGTALLLAPKATPPGREIGALDALFTATSAVCVTGLVVRDTGAEFTRYGQVVILGLIQLGGLGIMTLGAFFIATLGRGLGIRARVLMRDAILYEDLGQIATVLRFILLWTAVTELSGAACLFLTMDFPAGLPLSERFFRSLFHAISAFCNAGFGLDPLSVTGWPAPAQVAILALIVVGGLGFVVNYHILYYPGRILRRLRRARRLRTSFEVDSSPLDAGAALTRPFRLHTRIVVYTSLTLILLGAAAIAFFERGGKAFEGLGPGGTALAALFQSVTTRTAGFNTVDIGALRQPTQFLMILLMFVGASPGSTGGGIKTATAFLLFTSVVAVVRGREEVEVFGRTIPRPVLRHSVCIGLVSLSLVALVAMALSHTNPGFPFLQVLFETTSAFGTVGLSTGITPALSDAGKAIIMGLMFVGRVGPLTFVLALANPSAPKRLFRYPKGTVLIG